MSKKFKPDEMPSEELEKFLEKFDLTNESFAEIIGVTHECVDHWLAERRKIPPTTAKLVRFFENQPSKMKEF